MESEKVKEIKKVLEEGQFNTINHHQKEGKPIKISFADILTLINELESENERLENKNYQLEQDLGQCENGYNLELHTARYQLNSANEDLIKAEKRIAELEKENERLANVTPYQVVISDDKFEELKKNAFEEFNLTKIMLKHFAERLKEKVNKDINTMYLMRIDGVGRLSSFIDQIDETLKEFINE